MSTKLFNVSPRKPLSEDAARKLEEAIAAKGEGIAGRESMGSRNHETVSSQAYELIESRARDVMAGMDEEPAAEAGAMAAEPAVAVPQSSSPRITPNGRARKGKSTREPPPTGVGTIHNPRVRKTDGVKTRSTTVHLPIELAKKLAVHCAVSGRKQSEVIAEAVQVMLGD